MRRALPFIAPFLVLLLAVLPVAGAAPDISVKLTPERPEVGLVIEVLVSVSGAEGADCDLLDVPAVVGARLNFLSGPSTRNYSVSINGRTSGSLTTTWRFELIPEQPGPLLLPPFLFSCRGASVETDARELDVADSNLKDRLVTLDVRPSIEELWVGQVLELEVEATVHPDAEGLIPRGGLELALPWLAGVPGLHPRDIPNPSCRSVFPMPVNGGAAEVPLCQTREIVDGESRLVLRTRVPLLATQAGLISLGDSRFSVRLVVESRRERDPFFAGLLNRSSVVPTRVIVTDAVSGGASVLVKPTPLEGRPDSFTNAVGRFVFGGSAGPSKLAVGESCRLRLTLRSEDGAATNLDLLEWPEFADLLGDFRLFGKDETKGTLGRVLEFEISPKDSRVSEIPAIEFSFFDTSTGVYETRRVGPFPLEVAPGGDGGLTELAVPEEILNDLESIRTDLPQPQSPAWPAWATPALALLAWGLVELRVAIRRWRGRNPEKVVRKGARAALEKALSQASSPSEVGASFARYLAARLDGPSGGLTAEEAATRVSDAALAQELLRVVSGWEAAYLGGATVDLNAVRAEARTLADALEVSA